MNTMQLPKTLCEFFARSGTRYRVFDLGRGIRKLSGEQFEQFERGDIAYPYPLQQAAWLGILGWDPEQKSEQFIWFLKFPLDESAHLLEAVRDQFLHALLESIGSNIQAAREGGEFNDAMSESPFGFKPREAMMAGFHAKATRTLGQAPSRFYAHARDYLAGTPGYEQWAFVGLQGLADVCAHLDEEGNEALVLKALPQLPAPALNALCGFLENEVLGTALSEALLARLQQELATEAADMNVLTALIRAFAQSRAAGLRQAGLDSALASRYGHDINVLAAIAARNWEELKEESRCRRFIEALAGNNLGHDAFTQVMADLLYLPGMRVPLLAQLRATDRSATVSAAVGHMFGQALG